MGQYYLTCNLDKRQLLHPHKFDDGLKLLEFGCSGNGTMMALAILLSDGCGQGGGDFCPPPGTPNMELIGSWAGDRIVVAGDYAADNNWLSAKDIREARRKIRIEHVQDAAEDRRQGRNPHAIPKLSEITVNLYRAAWHLYEDISDKITELLGAHGEGPYPTADYALKWRLDEYLSRAITSEYASSRDPADFRWIGLAELRYIFQCYTKKAAQVAAMKEILRKQKLMSITRRALKYIDNADDALGERWRKFIDTLELPRDFFNAGWPRLLGLPPWDKEQKRAVPVGDVAPPVTTPSTGRQLDIEPEAG